MIFFDVQLPVYSPFSATLQNVTAESTSDFLPVHGLTPQWLRRSNPWKEQSEPAIPATSSSSEPGTSTSTPTFVTVAQVSPVLIPLPVKPKLGRVPKLGGNERPVSELLLVDVVINGRRLKNIVHIEQRLSSSLLIPVEAWTEARLEPLAEPIKLSDGTLGYRLELISGATYVINR